MGNKVIRLTEADIRKIVRSVLKEQEESELIPCPSGGVFKKDGSKLLWANNENDKFYEIWEVGAKPTFKFENNRVIPVGYLDAQSQIFDDGTFMYQALRGANILPLQRKFSNQITKTILFYSLDEEGRIHGDASTVIKVPRNVVKNDEKLTGLLASDGTLPERSQDNDIVFGDTYVRINSDVLITVRSLGPQLRYSTPAKTTTTRKPKPVIDRLEMSLTDMFVFDTTDFVDDARATAQINNFIGLLTKYAKEFNTEQNNFKNHIIKSEPKVYGYASIDNDPTEKTTGKFSPCKGQSTKHDYNKCLSQYRADKVTEIINDGLSGTGMDIFKAIGVGETEKFAPGMKWPEVKDPKRTAPNRRVYTYIPPFTYRVN